MNADRRRMANQILQSNSLSAVVFWKPDELVMMLGYMPLWGLSFLVYTADDEPVLFVPELEPEDILPVGIRIQTFPWGNTSCSDPWDKLFTDIRQLLSKKGLSDKPISFINEIGGSAPCRMSGEQPLLPLEITKHLAGLSESGFKDCTKDLLDLYRYKTDTDIEALKLTHQVSAVAVQSFYKYAKTGISEAELSARIEYSVHEMVGQKNITFARAWPMIQSGMNTAESGKYNRTTGKILADGELVLLEMGVCVNGYWADITRTTATTRISEVYLKMFETVKSAQEIALAMLKPGAVMGDVDAAARAYICDVGYDTYFNHPLGHQTGFRYHDPGAGLQPGCTEVLREGMVLTVEPGIYGTELNGGIRIEDNVLITGDGYEILSDFSRELSWE